MIEKQNLNYFFYIKIYDFKSKLLNETEFHAFIKEKEIILKPNLERIDQIPIIHVSFLKDLDENPF